VSALTVKSIYGFGQGFDRYDDHTLVKRRRNANQGVTSPGLVKLATQWLAEWGAGDRRKPFFLFLHMWDVHYDYAPPPPYDRLFDPTYEGDLTGANFESDPRIHASMPQRDLEHLIALYDGEIRFTDEHLGVILQELRRSGVLDDTIVVVTADHGEEFFEHGRKGHAHALYDESLLVPLVIRYPRLVAAGQRIERQVRLMDVAPTILDLAGIRIPTEFGVPLDAARYRHRSLSPWITGRDPDEVPHLVALSHVDVLDEVQRSARTDTHKLIETGKRRSKRALFDLGADPGEQTSIATALSGLEIGLRLHEVIGDATELSADRRWARSVELPKSHLDRLRALGYVR
jgi:arylsulfatase A-like enzyme